MIQPRTLSKPSSFTADAAVRADLRFLTVVLRGFNGLRKTSPRPPLRWDPVIAERFTYAVFKTSSEIDLATAYTQIRELAEAMRYDFTFCRNAAYFLSCIDLSDEDARTNGKALHANNYWQDPCLMEPWSRMP